MIVAVLGTGIMGAGMAGSLLRDGFAVRVWNRSQGELAPLVERGAERCASPAEAARGADVVLTMVSDGPAVEAVMGTAGGLRAMAPGTLWLQTSTVGLEWTARFAARAAAQGVDFVDAPMLGSREPAENGDLVVLAGGDDAAIDRAQPVFAAVGRRTVHVGPVGAAGRAKLVVNNWIIASVGALAETLVLAETLDVDPGLFLELMEGSPLLSPHAASKFRAMRDGEFEAQLPLRLAHKDLGLVLEAAEAAGAAASSLGMTRAVREAQAGSIAGGHGNDDLSAVLFGVRSAAGRPAGKQGE
jgi:3-hydroxyisobutyrate dehydrogenase